VQNQLFCRERYQRVGALISGGGSGENDGDQ